MVRRGVKAQGLDVSQEGDPLVQPRPSPPDLVHRRHQGVGEQRRLPARPAPCGQSLELPCG
jgi:hypothetical protein